MGYNTSLAKKAASSGERANSFVSIPPGAGRKPFTPINLKVEEFNSEPVAGMTVTDRIDEMLDHCTLAFLIMTGEDEHADTTVHARENVIHETGRAQQKLGSKRAIVLLEEGLQDLLEPARHSLHPISKG